MIKLRQYATKLDLILYLKLPAKKLKMFCLIEGYFTLKTKITMLSKQPYKHLSVKIRHFVDFFQREPHGKIDSSKIYRFGAEHW